MAGEEKHMESEISMKEKIEDFFGLPRGALVENADEKLTYKRKENLPCSSK